MCADANGHSVDCHLREFACDGRCIPRSKLCDHEVDCTIDTAADESPLLCSQSTLFYMAFACCVNVYMVSVHTSST